MYLWRQSCRYWVTARWGKGRGWWKTKFREREAWPEPTNRSGCITGGTCNRSFSGAEERASSSLNVNCANITVTGKIIYLTVQATPWSREVAPVGWQRPWWRGGEFTPRSHSTASEHIPSLACLLNSRQMKSLSAIGDGSNSDYLLLLRDLVGLGIWVWGQVEKTKCKVAFWRNLLYFKFYFQVFLFNA